MLTIIDKSEVPAFVDRNIMTPDIIKVVRGNKGFYELSSGTFAQQTLYGVTVSRDGKARVDESKCFFSFTDAENYIDELDK